MCLPNDAANIFIAVFGLPRDLFVGRLIRSEKDLCAHLDPPLRSAQCDREPHRLNKDVSTVLLRWSY